MALFVGQTLAEIEHHDGHLEGVQVARRMADGSGEQLLCPAAGLSWVVMLVDFPLFRYVGISSICVS